jgi:hypothetical protein
MCLGALSARATAPKARSCFSGGDQNGGARTRRAPQAKQRLRSPPGAGIGPKQCPRPKGRTGNATRRTDSTIGTGDYGQSRTAGSLIILCNGELTIERRAYGALPEWRATSFRRCSEGRGWPFPLAHAGSSCECTDSSEETKTRRQPAKASELRRGTTA